MSGEQGGRGRRLEDMSGRKRLSRCGDGVFEFGGGGGGQGGSRRRGVGIRGGHVCEMNRY